VAPSRRAPSRSPALRLAVSALLALAGTGIAVALAAPPAWIGLGLTASAVLSLACLRPIRARLERARQVSARHLARPWTEPPIEVAVEAGSGAPASVRAGEIRELLRGSLDAADELGARVASVRSSLEQLGRSLAVPARGPLGEPGGAGREIGRSVDLLVEAGDQLQLLAINAAIEAVNAGESGRGFAALAGELKELAARTASAAQQLADQLAPLALRECVDALERDQAPDPGPTASETRAPGAADA